MFWVNVILKELLFVFLQLILINKDGCYATTSVLKSSELVYFLRPISHIRSFVPILAQLSTSDCQDVSQDNPNRYSCHVLCVLSILLYSDGRRDRSDQKSGYSRCWIVLFQYRNVCGMLQGQITQSQKSSLKVIHLGNIYYYFQVLAYLTTV